MRLLKQIVWLILAYLACVFMFDFSWRQSIILAIVCVSIIESNTSTKAEAEGEFRPFRFIVTPHLYPLLNHLGIVGSEADFRAISETSAPPLLWSQLNIFKMSVVAVVISWNQKSSETLVHFPHSFYYASDLRFETSLPGVEFKLQHEGTGWVEFFFEPQAEWIGFGIEVNLKWWENQKSLLGSQLIVLAESWEQNIGRVRLTIARFPRAETYCFYPGRLVPEKRELHSLLINNGWKQAALNPDHGYYGEVYDHRYVQVQIWEVE